MRRTSLYIYFIVLCEGLIIFILYDPRVHDKIFIDMKFVSIFKILIILILVYCLINNFTKTVIPAEAGIQNQSHWIPVYTGMTEKIMYRSVRDSTLFFCSDNFAFANGMGKPLTKASSNGKEKPLAHDFTLNDICGKKVTLSQFRGKVVILNFWSIFCGPCLKEMPHLNKLYLEFNDKGLVVLGVAEDPAEKPVKSYIEEKKIVFPILMDKKRKVYYKYSLYGIPVSFLINKRWEIVEKIIGQTEWDSSQIREKIFKLLKE